MFSAFFASRVKSFLVVILAPLLLLSCSTEDNLGGAASNPLVLAILSLSWVPPSEREDNTPISMAEISGYRIYYGTTQGYYPNQIDVNGAYTNDTEISLVPGTYYAVVTTVDTDGLESTYSEEVAVTI